VNVYVVGLWVMADVLYQRRVDAIDATADRVRACERAREQRYDDRACTARRSDVDVAGEHLSVDVGPADVETDFALALVECEIGLTAGVQVAP
jgi:hypothetical protein